MIDFQMHFGYQFIVCYALAMTSTAVAMVIGSSVEDTKLAIEFLPMLIVPQIMFAGFFIATKLIPVWLRQVLQRRNRTHQYFCSVSSHRCLSCYALYLRLCFVRWLQYVMPLTYATRIFLEREFKNCKNLSTCGALLESIDVKSSDVYWYWIVLASLFATLRIGALILLERKSGKFNQ